MKATWVSIYPVLIVIKECLYVWGVTHARRMHLPVVHSIYPRTSVVHPSHHPEDGEVISSLIALAAALILVINDVLPDVTVDVFVTKGWSASPINGHNNDDSQDDGQRHQNTCKNTFFE